MSWMKNSSIGTSLGKLRGITALPKEFDATACYDSFKEHWQQICDIIGKEQSPGGPNRFDDDVRTVISNLDLLVTFLVLELKSNHMNGICLEYVLSENLLYKLLSWSKLTGRFANALRMEQLKLYEVLVSHSCKQLLEHENFHRPLLRLLISCSDVCFSVENEKRLVGLLKNLCILFIENNDLLSLFFDNQDTQTSKFIIFSLLIPFVHREGILGQQARDAILNCMALSKQNLEIADFIMEHSNVCPVLATGLSGLYSLLPRKFPIETDDWCRLTSIDVKELPELESFMNSLEFCNAVVQVSHSSVRNYLLELLYQGFLVPVIGPALLQAAEQELTAATAYFDLFIRSLTEPGLLHPFVKFTLREIYDDQRIIDSLIQRINNHSAKLSMVTIALMETLIDLNCEDIMMELVFKHLIPCNHVMASQRLNVSQVDPYCQIAEKLFHLHPNIPRSDGIDGSLYGDYFGYLMDVKSKIFECSIATSFWTYPYNGESPALIGIYSGSLAQTFNAQNENEDFWASGDNSSVECKSIIKDCALGCGSEPFGKFDSPDSSETISKPTFNFVKSNSTPNIGPFLNAVFNRLENIIEQNLYINLRITGLISRLAFYPQPLLRSFLLDHSLVFQPCIRSLFQVLNWLKQHIDNILKSIPPNILMNLVEDTETMLLRREIKLAHAKKYASETTACQASKTEHFDQGDFKRRSFSSALNSVFRKSMQTWPKETQNQLQPVASGYRFITKNEELRNVVNCAVLMSEWLKELSAIAQEHTVFRVSSASLISS